MPLTSRIKRIAADDRAQSSCSRMVVPWNGQLCQHTSSRREKESIGPGCFCRKSIEWVVVFLMTTHSKRRGKGILDRRRTRSCMCRISIAAW